MTMLPQVASLAIASANGLLLKGGSEASYSNEIMLSIVKSALQQYGCSDAISMVILLFYFPNYIFVMCFLERYSISGIYFVPFQIGLH